MRVYAAPLLSQRVGLQTLASQSEESFDCLQYYLRLYPCYSPLFGVIAALRQQAFNIYLNRVLLGYRTADVNESSIENFITTLQSLPESSPGQHVLVWACFIAASASRTHEYQVVLEGFLQKQYYRNRFANLRRALELLRRIWDCDFEDEDWPSLLPEPRVFIM